MNIGFIFSMIKFKSSTCCLQLLPPKTGWQVFRELIQHLAGMVCLPRRDHFMISTATVTKIRHDSVPRIFPDLSPSRSSRGILCKTSPDMLHISTELDLLLRGLALFVLQRVSAKYLRDFDPMPRSGVWKRGDIWEDSGISVSPDLMISFRCVVCNPCCWAGEYEVCY